MPTVRAGLTRNKATTLNMDDDVKASNLKTSSNTRVPKYSHNHPMIPNIYVPQWKTDMKNQKIISDNAVTGGVPNHEHDENVYLDKREQVSYNVENRGRVRAKYDLPKREPMLHPPIYHHYSRYQSGLMSRKA